MPHRDVAYGSGGARSCASCHRGQPRVDSFEQASCLHCHDPIAAQLRDKKGHHGALIAAQGPVRCASCHDEHSGAAWPTRLVSWPASEQAAFGREHGRATGFNLEGRHQELACTQCHDRRLASGLSTFTGLSSQCQSCHLAQSHHGNLREPLRDCARCHTARSWTQLQVPLRFDHARDTAYALRGAHAQADCQRCHAKVEQVASAKRAAPAAGPLFALPAERFHDCQPCHTKRSPHGGSFGPRLCKGCHSEARGWSARLFRHGEEAGFALLGKHADARCADCHRKNQSEPPQSRCGDCHGHNNVHGARFAQQGDCNTCHSPTAWSDNVFDHQARTGFALDNRHTANTLGDCLKCHRRNRGSLSGFESLHLLSATGPKASLGLRVDCRGCHAHKQQHEGSRTPEQRTRPCLSCHERAGSPRLARILLSAGEKSAEKSSEKSGEKSGAQDERLSWFGHGPGKPFRLFGGHSLAVLGTCQACHPSSKSGFAKLPMDCASCHKKRDAHRGTLGNCGRCHDPAANTWQRTPRLDHDAVFALKGSHTAAACAGCHPGDDPAKQYRGRPTLCGASECHQRKDTLHRGSRGPDCGSSGCHSPLHSGWKIPKFHESAPSELQETDIAARGRK